MKKYETRTEVLIDLITCIRKKPNENDEVLVSKNLLSEAIHWLEETEVLK
jgi:hypothetical protein